MVATKNLLWFMKIVVLGLFIHLTTPIQSPLLAQDKEVAEENLQEIDLQSSSILRQAWESGIVVFSVLLCLIVLSILSWGVGVAKILYLKKIASQDDLFINNFWDSKSLNELNNKLKNFPESPAREIFKKGYAELVRGSQLKEQASSSSMSLAIQAALSNMQRSLIRTKIVEKRKLENRLPLLAITASASPFIGLFGTVWGIMGAFESIAKSGSTSLAAVAPGIAEALIATAFGLGAAIPAVIAYNLSQSRIRQLMGNLDGFSADFMNIVERYLVSERSKANQNEV